MDSNRNMVLAIGAGLAVLAGIVIAFLLYGRGPRAPQTPPAEKGSLSVDVKEAPTLDPARKLRCYVNGQFVGETSLNECARRNGVSTQALDVGLDESGALVAAETASLAPPPVLPPVAGPAEEDGDAGGPDAGSPDDAGPAPSDDDFQVPTRGAGGSQCLRHVNGDWRQVSSDISLEACVSLLFDSSCVRPGEAEYGRWGDTTLRLVPRRVEQSTDNRTFRTLERRPSC